MSINLDEINDLFFSFFFSLFSTNTVVLGGTHQEGDYDLKVREKDTKFIYEGCHRILPSLKVTKKNI